MPKATPNLITPSNFSIVSEASAKPVFLTAVARIHLSLMIRDPFVRKAFERAERDGLAPTSEATPVKPQNLNGGAAEPVKTLDRLLVEA